MKELIDAYNLPKTAEFKRVELEDSLINTFGSLHYRMYPTWTETDTGVTHPTVYVLYVETYHLGVKSYQSEHSLTTEDALKNLLISNCDNHVFIDLMRKVYEL